MLVIGKLLKRTSSFLAQNWWATIYFNFRMLPLRQAIRLPFHFCHGIRFERLTGQIILDVEKPTRAMVRIGGRGSDMFARSQTIIDLAGLAYFEGACEIGHGALLRIEDGGSVRFGRNVRLGAKTKLCAANSILFGDEIDFSWECQIFDTNFHWMRDCSNDTTLPKVGIISIGSRNWFGNRVTVSMGCHTSKDVTVASNSLCNKDYRALGERIIIAGTPAKIVRREVYRLFEGVDIPATGHEYFK